MDEVRIIIHRLAAACARPRLQRIADIVPQVRRFRLVLGVEKHEAALIGHPRGVIVVILAAVY